jgi:hypothetical protein
MAARGVLPGLKPADLVTTLAGLCYDTDVALASLAEQSLCKLPKAALDSALEAPLQAPVLARLVVSLRATPDASPEHFGKLLQQSAIVEDSAVEAARHASEMVGEVIATNEALLLRFPRVIEALPCATAWSSTCLPIKKLPRPS